MQFRQWITLFNSGHSRSPQTPILFQQSLSLRELKDFKLDWDRSVFISFFPRYDGHGSSKPLPPRFLRIDLSGVRGGSALHSDQAQDKAPYDRTRWLEVDLQSNRKSNPANEKHALKDPARVRRLHRSLPPVEAGHDRPVVRREPNHPSHYLLEKVVPAPTFWEAPNSVYAKLR